MKCTVLNVSQNHFVRGGSDRYFFNLGELLTSDGYKVIPFSAADPRNVGSSFSRYFPTGADFDDPRLLDVVRFLYSAPARRQLLRLLADETVDLAHLHIYYGKLTASILEPLRRAGIPIVHSLHEYKTVCPISSLYRGGGPCEACAGRAYWHCAWHRCNRGSLSRSALSATEAYLSRALGATRKVDRFIAVSDFVREKVVSLGLPEERVITVYNFLDPGAIVPAASAGDYLLYCGRLVDLKGLNTLLDAIKLLSEDQELHIAGTGEQEIELRARVEEEGLRQVRFLGFLNGEALDREFRGARCTVIPSECYETFGLTALESFAHGKPVVATRIGGLPEVVSDGENGWLVEPRSPNSLADRLRWMMTHPAQAQLMGAEGRKTLEERFSPQAHLRALSSVYEELLTGG